MGDILDFLSPEDLYNIRTDVRDAVLNHDKVMYGVPYTKPITFIYRRLLSAAADMSSGAITPVWEDTKINGYGAPSTAFQAALHDDLVRKADEFVMFDPTQLSAKPGSDDQILLMSSFQGKITLTSGSVVVTGTNTNFVLDGVLGGDWLLETANDTLVKIDSISSNEQLLLESAWSGSDLYDIEFEIYRSYIMVDFRIDAIGALIRLGLRRSGG